MIKIFESSARDFTTNGIKILHPLTAEVFKEDNGDYYLEATAPISEFEYLAKGNIIVTDTPWGPQGFRISTIEKRVSKIYVKAWHLFYDAGGFVINNSYVYDNNCNYALEHLNAAADAKTPFSTYSDVDGDKTFRIVRDSLESAINTALETYGGHLVRDNWQIEIRAEIGEDRGVVISYGKNLKDMTATEDWTGVCTKILPYTTYDNADVMLDAVYVTGAVQYGAAYTRAVRFDNELDDTPYKNGDEVDQDAYLAALKTWLKGKADAYLADHAAPNVNYKVSAVLQNVADVGDVIIVKNPRYGVEVETRVISVKYDCIRGKYKEIEFGNFSNKLQNILTTVAASAEKEVAAAVQKSTYAQRLEKTAEEVLQALGGYCVKEQDRLYCVDALPIEDAKNVLLINKNGIALSQNGMNGDFSGVLSITGEMDFKNISAMNLTADLIKGGTLKLGGTQAGAFELYDGTGGLIVEQNREGVTLYTDNGQTVRLNAADGLCGYVNGQRYWWADGKTFHTYKMEAQELTVADAVRVLRITTDDNDGVAVVSCV